MSRAKRQRVHICLTMIIAAIFGHCLVDVQAISKGQVIPNKALSSPSHITVTLKSSLWLHWNYTYGGDDYIREYPKGPTIPTTLYIKQIAGYKGPVDEVAFFPLATRDVAKRDQAFGKWGTRTRWKKASRFSGRVDVKPDNNTLVVHNLRFNDSGTNFSSYIFIERLNEPFVIQNLEPVVTIEVIGAPKFTLPPPSAVTVSENSNLTIKVQMDGNPKPSAIFQWPHDNSKDQIIPGTKLYPYIYESTYTLYNISASVCGRILNTKVTNSVGTSVMRSTNVAVLLKLDANPDLKAGKPSTNCVHVKWNQPESGTCVVNYEIQFKDSSDVITSRTVHNTGSITVCFVPRKVNITNVQLKMSFKTTTKTFTAIVSESPIPTTHAPTTKASTSATATTTTTTTTTTIVATTKTTATAMTQTAAQGKGVIAGLAVVVAIESTVLIIIIVLWFVKGKRNVQPATKEDEEVVGNASDDEMDYMDMQDSKFEADSNYESLQLRYGEVGKKEIDYENVETLRVARI